MPFAPNPKLVTQLASRFPKRPTVGSQVDLAKGPAYPDKTGVTDQVTINKPPPGAGMGGGPMIHPPPNIGGIGGPGMGGGPMIHPPPNIGGIGGPSMGGVTPLPASSPSYSGGFGMRNPMPRGVGQFTTQPAPMPTKMAKGGQAKAYAKGGSIDGCAQRGKTRGRIVK